MQICLYPLSPSLPLALPPPSVPLSMDYFYLPTVLGKHSPGTHLIHMQPHKLLSEPPTMKEDINIPCNLKYTHTHKPNHTGSMSSSCPVRSNKRAPLCPNTSLSPDIQGGQIQRSDPHRPCLNLLLKTAGRCGLLWENGISSFPAIPVR